jgi:cyclic pyranopterin phosphate synthase
MNDRRPLIDGHRRIVDHLRLSVTSACNLRCLYCRPTIGKAADSRDLSDAQRLDLVRYLCDVHGLRQVRLTGGEPLLHGSIVRLIATIRSSFPDLSLAMTTNGRRLKSLAGDLRAAGLDRLNISLDSIDPQTYRVLTGGELRPVLEGIDAAAAAGFPPPRLNTVVLSGVNDHQLPEMVSWAIQRGMEVRFLEAMPIGPAAGFNREHFVPASRIKDSLKTHYRLNPMPRQPGETAARFAVEDASIRGAIGIIAPISEPFCGECRRMRLTADGKLFPCLLDSRFADLSSCWDGTSFEPDKAETLILSAVAGKAASGLLRQDTAMIKLGG